MTDTTPNAALRDLIDEWHTDADKISQTVGVEPTTLIRCAEDLEGSMSSKNTHARLNSRGQPTTETCGYQHCSATHLPVDHLDESFCSRECALHYQMDHGESA